MKHFPFHKALVLSLHQLLSSGLEFELSGLKSKFSNRFRFKFTYFNTFLSISFRNLVQFNVVEITEKGEERKTDLYICCFILGKNQNFELIKVSYNLSRMLDCHVIVMKYSRL